MNFSRQRYLVGFHWNLSDSKTPRVSTTFLSILADLNNAVVWSFSIFPLISNSSIPILQSIGNRSKYTNYNWYYCYLRVLQLFFLVFFLVLWPGQIFVNLFTFFLFSLTGLLER